MQVEQAIDLALDYVKKTFKGNNLENVGLEEVEFDDSSQEWEITVGFSRPWDFPQNPIAKMQNTPIRREYKIVRISDQNPSKYSIKIREVAQ